VLPAQGGRPSVPEVAVVVTGADGVVVENCFIGGFDFGVVVVGSKAVVVAADRIDATSIGISVSDSDYVLSIGNVIGGQGIGIRLERNSLQAAIYGNTIGAGATGLELADASLESAIVARNVVNGSGTGLLLEHGAARFFGAQIFLNDFVDARKTLGRPVGASEGWQFEAQLSAGGQGNYWGQSCAEGGFTPEDSPSPGLIVDSHPYGEPVAMTQRDGVPKPCR
jgi:hypothetical protein